MDFKIIDSNKGGKCVVVDNFKYRKFRVNKNGNVVWRCFVKNCTSTVTTCSEIKNIIGTKNTHNNHEQTSTLNIQIQEVRNECKRKAANNIHETPRKIIRKEISTIQDNMLINDDVNLIRKSMYRERKKIFLLDQKI